MKTIITGLSILISIFASAQIQQVNNGSFNELVFFVNTNTINYDENAKGSPYLNDAFIPAQINEIKETQFVRFNALENTIELKDSDDKILTLSRSYDYKIKLLDGSNKVYETHSYIDENQNKVISFFEKISQTKNYSLYLKERIIYIPTKKAKSSYEQDIPGEFKKGNTLFYVTALDQKSITLEAIPKKRKKLSQLFKERTKSVEKFMKKEGLKITQKEDIEAILTFYFDNK